MKLAISNIAWNPSEDSDIRNILSNFNIEGIEVAPTKIWPQPLQASKKALQEYRQFWQVAGIRIVALQSLFFGRSDLMLFHNEQSREAMFQYLCKMFDLAQELGAQSLIFGSPKNRQLGKLDKEKAFSIAVDFFGRIAERAIENDVCLCIEANPSQYACDFITCTEEALSLVKTVSHEGFGLHLDSACMSLAGDNIRETIMEAVPLLQHFHMSEPYLEAVGNGVINYHEFLANLVTAGYSRWVSIEMKAYKNESNRPRIIDAISCIQGIIES